MWEQEHFLPTSNGFQSSPLKLAEAFISVCKTDTSLTKWFGLFSFTMMFHRVFLFTVSKAFVKSANIMYRGILCSMHFSFVYPEEIMYVVPQFARKLHCASGKKSSARVHSRLSSMRTNSFSGMKRSENPQ